MSKRKMSTDEFNQVIGERLRTMREGAGLTQEQMAERLKVHPNTVSNYERGFGVMTVLFLRACHVTGNDAGKMMASIWQHNRKHGPL
jgi:DNA-binding XRE family transcriptional regulator